MTSASTGSITSSSASKSVSSTTIVSTTSTSSGATQTQYGQCGGKRVQSPLSGFVESEIIAVDFRYRMDWRDDLRLPVRVQSHQSALLLPGVTNCPRECASYR